MTKSLDDVIYGAMAPGLYRLSAWVTPGSVERRVRKEGWQYAYLDGNQIRDKGDFLHAMDQTLRFPSYFGYNWDALEECLTDLSWLPAPGYVILYNRPNRFISNSLDEWTTARLILEEAVTHWHREGSPLFVLFRRAGFSLPTVDWL